MSDRSTTLTSHGSSAAGQASPFPAAPTPTAPHPFGLVCFRLRADDAVNAELLRRLNASGELFLSHTDVRGRYVLRMATGGPTTTSAHLRLAWDRIGTVAGAL